MVPLRLVETVRVTVPACQNALRATGVRAVFSPDSPSVRFNRFICKQGPLGASLCRDMMLHVFGRNPKSLKMVRPTSMPPIFILKSLTTSSAVRIYSLVFFQPI